MAAGAAGCWRTACSGSGHGSATRSGQRLRTAFALFRLHPAFRCCRATCAHRCSGRFGPAASATAASARSRDGAVRCRCRRPSGPGRCAFPAAGAGSAAGACRSRRAASASVSAPAGPADAVAAAAAGGCSDGLHPAHAAVTASSSGIAAADAGECAAAAARARVCSVIGSGGGSSGFAAKDATADPGRCSAAEGATVPARCRRSVAAADGPAGQRRACCGSCGQRIRRCAGSSRTAGPGCISDLRSNPASAFSAASAGAAGNACCARGGR